MIIQLHVNACYYVYVSQWPNGGVVVPSCVVLAEGPHMGRLVVLSSLLHQSQQSVPLDVPASQFACFLAHFTSTPRFLPLTPYAPLTVHRA